MPQCSKCERKVHPTTHTADGYKVDYYIIDATVGKEPVVLCKECYDAKDKPDS